MMYGSLPEEKLLITIVQPSRTNLGAEVESPDFLEFSPIGAIDDSTNNAS
jgi:hypothetical protein